MFLLLCKLMLIGMSLRTAAAFPSINNEMDAQSYQYAAPRSFPAWMKFTNSLPKVLNVFQNNGEWTNDMTSPSLDDMPGNWAYRRDDQHIKSPVIRQDTFPAWTKFTGTLPKVFQVFPDKSQGDNKKNSLSGSESSEELSNESESSENSDDSDCESDESEEKDESEENDDSDYKKRQPRQ